MPYSVAVCIKPVPDPKYYDKVTIDPVKKTISRTGVPIIMNQVDKNALELALQLKASSGGSVTALSMAPPNGEETLREALAMGADSAYLLSDPAFGGADTLATSYTLFRAIKKVEAAAGRAFDFVLCGCESADGATAQVPSQLGEWLDAPHLWNVCAFEEDKAAPQTFHIKTKIGRAHV
jgi:electron transfer flavoprotein beta subunit